MLYVSLYLEPNKELLMCSFLLVLLLKSRFFDGIINLLLLLLSRYIVFVHLFIYLINLILCQLTLLF